MDMQNLYDLRARVLRGEPVKDEELADAIKQLRVGREAVGSATAAKKSTTPKINISLADLMKPKAAATPAEPAASATTETPPSA
jgi:hypothetical protein